MRRLVLRTLAFVCFLTASIAPAISQTADSTSENSIESRLREQKNAWTVGIAGGLLDTTNMRFADEMGRALNDGDNLRVMPMVGFGSASNLEDLLYLRGVDVAFTQSDVFEYFKTERKIGNLDKRVQFVVRFPVAELHILARSDIRSVEDLRGKRVSFGPQGTSASMTGTIVLQRLDIPVEKVFIDHTQGMKDLASGKLAAIVRVAGRPLGFFSEMPANTGFHLLSVPFTEKFADYYTLSELSSDDYPGLIPKGQVVETLGVPTVLAVYNWPKSNPRYKKVERFVERLFQNWDKLQVEGYHPKWREVNLAATVPGWQRFSVAERMLQQAGAQNDASDDLSKQFGSYLDAQGNQSQADRDALFKEFMAWRAQQNKRQQKPKSITSN